MEKIALTRVYQDAQKDAALIAAEVISKRFSSGWLVLDDGGETKKIAANVEKILAVFNIGYDMSGRWIYKAKGSNFFERSVTATTYDLAMDYFKEVKAMLDK